LVKWLSWWLDGGVHWRDQPGPQHKGYCRANRLLFMDYREVFYWFGVVDIGLATAIGVLEGIKLGPHQCGATLMILVVLMFLFLVVICWKRPYNSPFGSIFNIFTAFLQLLGACFVAAWMFSGVRDYREYGEDTTVVSLYLLLLKTVFDILPKLKQIGKFVISAIRGKRSKAASKKSRRNADTGLLSQQLLAAVRDDAEELAGRDHAELATREMQQRGQLNEADAELPEMESSEATSPDWTDQEEPEEDELFFEIWCNQSYLLVLHWRHEWWVGHPGQLRIPLLW
jgi:hypothetical protein